MPPTRGEQQQPEREQLLIISCASCHHILGDALVLGGGGGPASSKGTVRVEADAVRDNVRWVKDEEESVACARCGASVGVGVASGDVELARRSVETYAPRNASKAATTTTTTGTTSQREFATRADLKRLRGELEAQLDDIREAILGVAGDVDALRHYKSQRTFS